MVSSDWVNIAISVLTSIIIVLPLVVNLIKYVKQLTQEKNWAGLLAMVNKYIIAAEEGLETGAEKEDWVVSMIMASASVINYNIDEAQLRALIRDIIEVTNLVNIGKELPKEESDEEVIDSEENSTDFVEEELDK